MRCLTIAMVLAACTAAFGATPPTKDNMRIAWDKPRLNVDAGPVSATCLFHFTTDGVDPYGIQGWSFGICIDKSKVNVEHAVLGADALICKAGGKPDFAKVNLLADGVTCGVVIDNFAAERLTAPRTGFEALDVTFSNVGLSAGEASQARSCDILGTPPVACVVVVDGRSIPFGVSERLVFLLNDDLGRARLEAGPSALCHAAVRLKTGRYEVNAVRLGVRVTPEDAIGSIDRGRATAHADFFHASLVPGGATLAIAVSLSAPFLPLPASAESADIALIEVLAVRLVRLEIADSLGSPPLDIIIEGSGGTVPRTEIEIGPPVDVEGCPTKEAPFVRGDANQDGRINIADVICIALHLFGELGFRECPDSLDVTDNESLNLADPIFLLDRLFGYLPWIPPPTSADLRGITAADCGLDETGDGALRCWSYPACDE